MKITRRNMITGGIASILAFRKCPAVITKSLVGKNNFMYDNEGNEVPSADAYISDGLVLMWDAKENVGFYEHDPYPERWIDLSGNGLDLAVNNEMGTFTGDKVVFNSATGCFAQRNTGRADLISLGVTSLPTVEIVHLNRKIWGVILCLGYLENGYRIYGEWDGNHVLGMNYWKRRFQVTDTICSFSCSENVMTMNGVDLGDIVSSTNFGGGGESVSHFSVKGYASPSNSYSNIYNEVCCIRAYNRVLTDEERMKNSLIDKARFNLP